MLKKFFSMRHPFVYQFIGILISVSIPLVARLYYQVGDFNLIAIYGLLLTTFANSNLFSKDRRTLKQDGSKASDFFSVISYALGVAIINVKASPYLELPTEKYNDEPFVIVLISAICIFFLVIDAIAASVIKHRKKKETTPEIEAPLLGEPSVNEVLIVKLKEEVPIKKQ